MTNVKNISYKSINSLIEKFRSTCQFCSADSNTFVPLLRKGVYPYDYMNDWDKFEETQLPPMKDLYSKIKKKQIFQKKTMNMQIKYGIHLT